MFPPSFDTPLSYAAKAHPMTTTNTAHGSKDRSKDRPTPSIKIPPLMTNQIIARKGNSPITRKDTNVKS